MLSGTARLGHSNKRRQLLHSIQVFFRVDELLYLDDLQFSVFIGNDGGDADSFASNLDPEFSLYHSGVLQGRHKWMQS